MHTKSKSTTTNQEKLESESLSSKELYHRLKSRLQELEKRKKSKSIFLLTMIFSAFTVGLSYYIVLITDITVKVNFWKVSAATIIGALLGGAFSICFYALLELQEIHLQSRISEYEIDDVQNNIEDDIFKNSIKMSYKYLDQYYLQTREQAQRGFLVTVCVAVFGAALVFAGIVAMFFGKVEPSYITCASGVITEFIAAIFFYLYNKTVSSMSRYHNKLVLSQNVSIALKVSDSLPTEDRTKTKNLIVAELLKDINAHLVKEDLPDTSGK